MSIKRTPLDLEEGSSRRDRASRAWGLCTQVETMTTIAEV